MFSSLVDYKSGLLAKRIYCSFTSISIIINAMKESEFSRFNLRRTKKNYV